MICFSYSARASPSWSSANLLTTCFSVLLKSNGSHHGKATICPKKFFPFPEIRGIIRVSYASFLIPAKNFAVFGVKFAITIYPRKGTETPTGGSRHRSVKITIYPRKGTETFWYSSRQMLRMITIYPRKGTKKHLCHWRLPAAEVLCFFLYSILQVGNCACRNRLCDRQRLDALRDVPLQGADLMQVGGDLLQGLFNVLCIQRQNALAL